MKRFSVILFFASCTCLLGTSIKETYRDYFPIGMALNEGILATENELYESTFLKHFNAATGENAFKWESIQPEEGQFDFRAADRIADFARSHNIRLWGHVLIWHNQTPDWVFLDGSQPASRELVLKRMQDHIYTLVGRYKDVIYGWDVVNEAISDEDSEYLRASKWYESLGEEFIEKAFIYAHAADPEAILAYNDYSLPNPVRRAKLKRLIQGLLKKEMPIHLVGLQTHYSIYWPKISEIEATLELIKEFGLKAAISEIDISIFHPTDKTNQHKHGLPADLELQQALRYADLMELYTEWSDLIERVTFWDIFDRSNWRNYFPVKGRTDYAGLIDRENKPKKAFDAILDRKRFLQIHKNLERLSQLEPDQ